MTRSISVGIDVGTSQVKVVVVEYLEKNEKNPKDKTRVIGTGIFESKGMEHGFVKNAKEVSSSVNSAIKAAEKAAGVKISRVYCTGV
jgi:cell division ATPase FtsA